MIKVEEEFMENKTNKLIYYRIGNLIFASELVLKSFDNFMCNPAKSDVVLKETVALPPDGEETISGVIAQQKTTEGWYYRLTHSKKSGLWVSDDYTSLWFMGENKAVASEEEEGLIRMALECLLVRRGFISLHAACVEINGEAIAFSGPSGLGKSTRAKCWMDVLGAKLISGDRPLIDVRNLEVYGVPWDGKEKCYRNVRYPLKCICDVRRSDRAVYIRKVSFEQSRRLLMRQCFMPMWDTETAVIQMMNVVRLAQNSEIVRIFCGRNESDAVELHRLLIDKEYKEENSDMKAKKGFVLRNIVDEYVLMPTGDNIAKFKGTMLLNEVSAFIWEKLQNPISRDDLLTAIVNEYEVSEERAAKDLDALLMQLNEFGVIEDD